MSNAPRVWFTADTHFGHAGALGLFRRPFASVGEMDAAMIENWNRIVGDHDLVWHLGDFGYRLKTARLTALLTALRGRKMLIIGNNDDEATTSAAGWEGVSHYAEIEIDRKRVVLCHYAFRSWNGMRRGSWNLHGHSHGALAPMPRQADAGVDVWNFRPIGFDEIGRKKSR